MSGHTISDQVLARLQDNGMRSEPPLIYFGGAQGVWQALSDARLLEFGRTLPSMFLSSLRHAREGQQHRI